MKFTRTIKVKNDLGLHTRPATVIVKMLQAYKASVQFTYKRDTINARSIMSILMLAVCKNSLLTITAEGEDAEKALEEIVLAFENKFWEKT